MKTFDSSKNRQSAKSITAFRIYGLFGSLDHDVALKEGGVTFIHGPNGSGKTTALLLLEQMLTLKFSEMRTVIFSRMEVDFSDGAIVILSRNKVANKRSKEPNFFDDDTSPEEVYEIKASMRRGRTLLQRPVLVGNFAKAQTLRTQALSRPSSVERLAPGMLDRIGPRSWRLLATGEVLGASEVATFVVEHNIRSSLPQWLLERVSDLNLGVIRAQRLFELNGVVDEEGAQEVKQIVSIFSQDVKQKIKQTIAQSALQFQKKEKTFPHRILSGEVRADSEAILRENYITLQERVSTLEKVGLQESSDSLVLPEIKLNPTHKRVLTLYLADINEKLDVFNNIFQQISLMSQLLSKKLRRKTFSINKTDGFKITSTAGENSVLKPTDLSSGEQHQLVMLYKLIFSDAPNQLYLIDEPEISLHVEWQRQFSDDLRLIAEARGHKFIIATHSPQIINGRLDLAVPLDGGI